MRPDLKIVAVAAPDNWTFLETLRPDERAVDFFHTCEHLGEVADRRDRLVRQARPARRREGRRKGRPGSAAGATTKTAVAERELRFFRKHRRRMRYASLKAKGCVSGVVEAANKVLANQRMKRARWRPEHPRLQGDAGPLRRRVADDDRNGRRERPPERPRGLTAAIPLPQTKSEYKMQNEIFTKIDLHPWVQTEKRIKVAPDPIAYRWWTMNDDAPEAKRLQKDARMQIGNGAGFSQKADSEDGLDT